MKSARLGDWLRTGGKLKETMAGLLVQQLREDWASERIGENVHDTILEDLEGGVGDEIPDEESGSATDEGMPNNEHRPRQILKKARCTKYVIVELPGGKFRLHKGGEEGCWMGRRRIFRNSREFSTRPDKSEYTHVCLLCWPKKRQGLEAPEDSASSPAETGDAEGELAAVPPRRPDLARASSVRALFWSWAGNGLKGKSFYARCIFPAG